jgi:hypothetical protein
MLALKLFGALLAMAAAIVVCIVTWGGAGVVVLPLGIAAILEVLEFVAELIKMVVEDFFRDFDHKKIALKVLDITISALKLAAAVSRGIGTFGMAAPLAIPKMIHAIASIASPALSLIKSLLLLLDLKLSMRKARAAAAAVAGESQLENEIISIDVEEDGSVGEITESGDVGEGNGESHENSKPLGSAQEPEGGGTVREGDNEGKSNLERAAGVFQRLAALAEATSSVSSCIDAWGVIIDNVLGVTGTAISVLAAAVDGFESTL